MKGNQDWEEGREERERLEEEELEKEEELEVERLLKEKENRLHCCGAHKQGFPQGYRCILFPGKRPNESVLFVCEDLHVSSLAGIVHLIPRLSGRRKRG